jgi:hypothetical protein
MMIKAIRMILACTICLVALAPVTLRAGASDASKKSLEKLLLGKDVRSLIQLPATKEGVKIYHTPPRDKKFDERGLDMEHLTKWLKERGVGVDTNETVMITEVIVGGDSVELHLGGGGMGRRGSEHANKKDPGFKRAGGSRINFFYDRGIKDADLEPSAFLDFAARVLDVGEIRQAADMAKLSPEARKAIESKEVTEGMTYQMVQLAYGKPEEKKINESGAGTLSETWFYMIDGHRVVVDFTNGKVSKVQKF